MSSKFALDHFSELRVRPSLVLYPLPGMAPDRADDTAQ